MERAKKELQKYGLIYLTIIVVFFANVVWGMSFATRPSYVYDWEGILTEEEVLEIDTLCRDIDINTTIEIVIVTLVSYDEPLKVAGIDEARVKYFNEYALDGVTGIGKEGEDNGILVILSTAMADYGIEVGYGLEGDLTDSECGRIGRDIINKYYKDEDYLSMFYEAVEAIGEEVGYGEPDVSSEPGPNLDGQDGTIKFYAIVIAIIGGGILIMILYIRDQDRKRREREERRRRARREALRASPPPPPKPVYRYVQCPTCDTKRKAKQKKAKTKEFVEDETIFSVLFLTLACLVCGTIITDARNRRRIETTTERQERRKREREDEEERRKRMEEIRERRREREDDDDDDYHSSFSSWGRSSSFGGGGGRSGGGGASGRLGR